MALDNANASERSPLLFPRPDPAPSFSNQPRGGSFRDKKSPAVVIFLLLFVILLDLGFELMAPAQTRVFERIYCREYYQNHDSSLLGSDGKGGVDEKYCKGSWVQGEVAMLKGWQSSLDSIGMLIFSIPWGYVSDRYGRKPVLLLITVALFLKLAYVQFVSYLDGAVSLKWTWLSATYTMFGGGIITCTAVIYTIVSDIVDEDKRVAVFFQVVAAQITTQFLGSLASGALMAWNPWIPMILGLIVKLIGIIPLLIIPETLSHDQTSTIRCPAAPNDSLPYRFPPHWRKGAQQASQWIRTQISYLTSHVKLFLIVAAFIVHMLLLNQEILRQYISTRYGQTLGYATLIISIRSGMILVLTVAILPVVSLYCRKRFGAGRSQILLARFSAAFMALGFLGVGLAPRPSLLIAALVVSSLGFGLFSFLRSLATTFVEPHQFTRLNSFIGIVDIIGVAIGSPLLAALFTKGVEIGGYATGLPFIFFSGVLVVILLGLMCVSA